MITDEEKSYKDQVFNSIRDSSLQQAFLLIDEGYKYKHIYIDLYITANKFNYWKNKWIAQGVKFNEFKKRKNRETFGYNYEDYLDKKRLKQEECPHQFWVKRCSLCNRIMESDSQTNDYTEVVGGIKLNGLIYSREELEELINKSCIKI